MYSFGKLNDDTYTMKTNDNIYTMTLRDFETDQFLLENYDFCDYLMRIILDQDSKSKIMTFVTT